MDLTHLDQAPRRSVRLGHLQAAWTDLGAAAGAAGVGVNRIEVEAGAWSTPAHEHGREEIFYVLSGRGLSWQDGRTAEISAGDCIVHRAGQGAHTLHALAGLDVLAFGPPNEDDGPREPDGDPPEPAPAPGPRPETIVNLEDVPPDPLTRSRVAHAFRAGDTSLRYLAYGTREPGDLCYYPRSRKIAFRGLGVIGRIEPLGYWDGED